MSRRRPAEESLLFDLPLEKPPAAEPEPAAEPAPAEEVDQPPLPLADEPELAPETPAREAVIPDSHVDEPSAATPAAPRGRPPGEPTTATLRLRAAAGIADLGVCAAVLVVLLVALLAQGVRPTVADWPAGVVFLLSFSFIYAVLPLAFWGRTPGMALSGLRSMSKDGRPLTFHQAVLSWLGGALTVALAGLPLLLALAGRSLSDLLSGSVTRRVELRR